MGTSWDAPKAFWADPSPENRAKLSEWLEMHVFDGAHLLLETHYHECADAIRRFVADAAK